MFYICMHIFKLVIRVTENTNFETHFKWSTIYSLVNNQVVRKRCVCVYIYTHIYTQRYGKPHCVISHHNPRYLNVAKSVNRKDLGVLRLLCLFLPKIMLYTLEMYFRNYNFKHFSILETIIRFFNIAVQCLHIYT